MRAHFALSCTAYRLLAWLAQGSEVFFDAQQNATGAGLGGWTSQTQKQPPNLRRSSKPTIRPTRFYTAKTLNRHRSV
jgi:hypothetical protein